MKNSYPSPFDIDVSMNGGYLYTTQARLSSRVANQRLTLATLETVNLGGKKVIDVGCGDGVYTYELYKKTRPKKMYGVDSSRKAVKIAGKIFNHYKNLKFSHADLYDLAKKRENFDIALVRGVIHHVDHPEKAIQSIAKVTSEILILEPNGYNPLLKIIEKISPCHRFHKEKSYQPKKIRYWLKQAGFTVQKDKFISIIPFFFPDTFTYLLKPYESLIENIPYLRNFLCGVYVVHAKKSTS